MDQLMTKELSKMCVLVWRANQENRGNRGSGMHVSGRTEAYTIGNNTNLRAAPEDAPRDHEPICDNMASFGELQISIDVPTCAWLPKPLLFFRYYDPNYRLI